MTQEAAEQLVEKSWHHLAWPSLAVIGLTIGAQFFGPSFLLMLAIGFCMLTYVTVRAFKDDQLMGILLVSGAFTGFTIGLVSSITQLAIQQKIWLVFGIISEPFVLATAGVVLGIGIGFIISRVQPLFERR